MREGTSPVEKQETVAVIFIKAEQRLEDEIRDAIAATQAKGRACLSDIGDADNPHPSGPCHEVTLLDAAYLFGHFDFVLIVRSTDVRALERFIVECVRTGTAVTETQTILGIGIPDAVPVSRPAKAS
ncbi:MAG: hypothetical protein JO093_01130 [Acidobacteria bacterium]|nr:hypothetical protein [Acidobacteriota bacterium]MBV9069019.1 hypothetical protein [Acidobacteriota bacterium]MBV9184185.1 hypothetical protein [Acidobacteriota bacterium]